MLRRWSIATIALSCGLASHPANACRTRVAIQLEDIRYAETVIVGRVLSYTIVRDQALRDRMLSNPRLPAASREFYTGDHSLMGDYARIEIGIDETLTGVAPRTLTVTWYNSTFGVPKSLPDGPFLFALRKPGSSAPPLRGPSATSVPNREPEVPTLLQAPCSSPFMFQTMSPEVQLIRHMIGARSN